LIRLTFNNFQESTKDCFVQWYITEAGPDAWPNDWQNWTTVKKETKAKDMFKSTNVSKGVPY
jgi:hypothetical protein